MRRLSYLGRVSSLRLLREVDLRRHAVLRIALEVLIPDMESCEVGPDAGGKLLHVGVVVLEGRVVPLTSDRDTILRPCKLIGQTHELLVALEVRILLLQAEEGAQGDVELGVSVDAGGAIVTGGKDSSTSVGDVGQDGGFFSDVSLDRGNQVGNQIETALLHDTNLGKGLINGLILLNQRVFRADIATACKEQNENEETHNPKYNP